MSYFVYILRNSFNKLYIGQTNNLARRHKDHSNSDAAKFTADYKGFELIFKEEFPTRFEAMRREKQLKGWTRAKKEALLVGNLELLKKL